MDNNGLAIKFFIQKDLSQEMQAELCETITALGGRVEQKVPRQGFVLVQPGTQEADRLRLCWTSAERPERHFVPYTYIDACKIAGMLLKQIFVDKGEPIKLHIDPSIANPNARAALRARIMHSGGDPSASAQSARVILADPNTEVFQHLVKTYQGVPEKYIESYLWVKKCVERGELSYTPVVYKNPGGRRPGEERMQFTETDERRLCEWIASKIPYKETGGRTGNRLYQQLCDLAHEPEHAWVSRHTWQSWRERYKKNSTRLDLMISNIVDERKPNVGEKGQYGYVRQPDEKPKRKTRTRKDEASSSKSKLSDDEVDYNQAGPGPLQMPPQHIGDHMPPMGPHPPPLMPVPMGMYTHPASGGPHPYPMHPHPHPHHLPVPGSMMDHIPQPNMPPSNSSELEEEEASWPLRVGNDPPPAWGKRKATDDTFNELGPHKRPRTEEAGGSGSVLHIVDQGIQDIAHEFRFTVQEVQEYYDRCGAMDRTRARFKAMRELLQTLKDPDE
ncbi:hypothetical protein OF83DRAFT_546940 [Amylostereum chailletii]|nr:hypothetical protein OF83DRAFT_546940 [Amylostereum chailletii]